MRQIKSDWQPFRQFRKAVIPNDFCHWLSDEGSLTQKLKWCCENSFKVKVLSQQWDYPQWNEAKALHMPQAKQYAVIRESELICDNKPWVFARSVIPRTTLIGPQRRLHRLGNKSLGSVLFADPSTWREPFEWICLTAKDSLYHKALTNVIQRPNAIWGRRSVFYLQEKPLLVAEIFLFDLDGA